MQNGQAMQAPASRVASPGKGRTAACGRNQSKMPTSSREKPKTMLFVSGREDHLFPEAAVEAAFRTMNEIYGEDRAALTTCFSEGGHHCGKPVQNLVTKFFKDKL